MKIVTKCIDENRKDSFWYSGQVAYIDTDHGKYSLEAIGDIKVMFEPDSDWYKGSNAVVEALNRKLYDEDLIKLSSHDGWGNNNWFEIIFTDTKGNTNMNKIDDVMYEYDEALEVLKTFVQERIYA
jgi:hypothetical protein